MKTRNALGTMIAVVASLTLVIAFQNCSGGGGGGGGGGSSNNSTSGSTASGLGAFIDDPVQGLSYKTSSGLSGVTNSLGQFQFNPGDTVTFYAMGVLIGSATPTIGSTGNAVITPVDLVPGAAGPTDLQVTAIGQFLATLNSISVGNGNGQAGSFTIPTGTTSTTGAAISPSQLVPILNGLFPSTSFSVTSGTVAQSNIQNSLNSQAFAGTIWEAICANCGGALLYLQPDGSISGFAADGSNLTGSWTASSTTQASTSVTSSTGATASGNLPGTGSVTNVDNSVGTLTFTEVSSAGPVTNNNIFGVWYATYIPNAYGISIGDSGGGCASLMVGPSTIFGNTNDGQFFTGSVSGGTATASFSGGSSGTNNVTLNFATASGTNTKNGQISGTLSLSRSGSCPVTKNNNNNNSGTGGM